MVRTSQKKARDKWDAENMATIGCKLKKEYADAFKAYATQQGTTVSRLIKEFVLDTIRREGENDGKPQSRN